MNPNKRPPPSSSAGAFEGGDATKRSREAILRPGKDAPGNVLLVRVTDIVHPVTIVALQQIFSRFGKVDKIVMFDKGSGSQALVQMANVQTATSAHEAADMQEMYSGCNLIRVGYSNLQNVTVKGNTERSWDFNIGPPLEGALPPGTTPPPIAASGASASGYHGASATAQPAPSPPSSAPHRHTPQQSYSPQQYSPYSAAQQPSPYVPPQQQQTYTPPQQSYGAPSTQPTYSPQQQHQQHQQPYGSVVATGGGTYTPHSYPQQGYAPPYGQPPPPPYSQQPYNPQPYGQQHYSSRGGGGSGGRGGSGDDTGRASGSNGVGARGSSGNFSRHSPSQTSTGYYSSSANVMPSPQSAQYGSIPFSSERSPAGGFGTMGIGGGSSGGSNGGVAGRPMPNPSRVGRGGGGGAPGAGGLGGGGASQGRGGGTGRGPPLGGGTAGLLQPPMHRQVPVSSHDNCNFRPQIRFRSSDKKPNNSAASGGATKPRSRVPRLYPVQIQALTAATAIAKKSGRHQNAEELLEGEAGKGAAAAVAAAAAAAAAAGGEGARANGKRTTLAGFVKGEAGSHGASGGGQKREMGSDQLVAATAKTFLGKRTNKREAAEMLGPDATDQLTAATAKVRVSDDGDGEEAAPPSSSSGKKSEVEAEADGGPRGAGARQDESKRKACAVAGNEEGDNGSGKRTAGAGGGGVAAHEIAVPRRGGLRSSSGGQGKSSAPLEETAAAADTVDAAEEGLDPSEAGQAKVGEGDGESRGAAEAAEKAEGEGDGAQQCEANGEAGEEKPEACEKETGGKGMIAENVDDEKAREEEADDGAEGEAKVKGEPGGEGENDEDDDDDDDAAGEGEAERVDVGAWAAAASASRSPIVMVRHVDALEVSPEAICHLFGLYGDVLKVKLVASRGMALVQMRYPIQAANAQRLLDQTPLSGMTLEVKASSQWTINDPTATDFSEVRGLHRYAMCPSPEDKRYRDSLSPPCPALVVDNVPPDVSAEVITSIFSKYGRVSSVDLDTHVEASLDAASILPGAGGSNSEVAKPSVQALVHMEADGKVRGTEAAVHALIMTHNLTLADRRLRVSFLSGERHIEK